MSSDYYITYQSTSGTGYWTGDCQSSNVAFTKKPKKAKAYPTLADARKTANFMLINHPAIFANRNVDRLFIYDLDNDQTYGLHPEFRDNLFEEPLASVHETTGSGPHASFFTSDKLPDQPEAQQVYALLQQLYNLHQNYPTLKEAVRDYDVNQTQDLLHMVELTSLSADEEVAVYRRIKAMRRQRRATKDLLGYASAIEQAVDFEQLSQLLKDAHVDQLDHRSYSYRDENNNLWLRRMQKQHSPVYRAAVTNLAGAIYQLAQRKA